MLSTHSAPVEVLHRTSKWGEVRRLACPLRRFPFAAPPNCGGKVVAPATKGGMHFQRPPGRLYGFIQTGVFYKFNGALPQPSAAEPLSNLRTLGAIAPSNFRTLTHAGCQSSCWWEQGFPLSHIPRKKAKHDASPFYFLYFHPFPSILPYCLTFFSDFHASLLLY